MHAFSRRHLLGTAAVLPVAFGLASCAGLTGAQVTAQVVNDVELIGSGLKSILPSLATIAGISTSAVETVTSAIDSVVTLGSNLSTSLSQTDGQAIVQQVESGVNAVVDTLAAFPLPAPIGMIIQAAAVLLPVIETGVGIAVNVLTPKTARLRAVAPLSVDQARLVLAGAAARH